MNRIRSLGLVLLSLGALGAAGPSDPSEVSPSPFAPARTVDGRNLTLLGAGVHKVDGTKDYDMALYVDETDARRAFPALAARAGGRTRSKLLASDHTQSFVVWGHFTKIAVMHFARAVDAAAVRQTLQEAFTEELGERATPELKKAAEAFLALFEGQLKEGDDLVLRTWEDGRIEVELAGARKTGPQSPKLTRTIWNAWLGAKPISPELRRALVERIDTLGR
jgi:hypothetical protein